MSGFNCAFKNLTASPPAQTTSAAPSAPPFPALLYLLLPPLCLLPLSHSCKQSYCRRISSKSIYQATIALRLTLCSPSSPPSTALWFTVYRIEVYGLHATPYATPPSSGLVKRYIYNVYILHIATSHSLIEMTLS